MMSKYNWKDNYGFDESTSTVIWLSMLGNKNMGINSTTRANPKYSQGNTGTIPTSSNGNFPIYTIFSSGVHGGAMHVPSPLPFSGFNVFIGQGINDTIINKSITFESFQGSSSRPNISTFLDLTMLNNIGNGYSNITLRRCALKGTVAKSVNLLNCKLYNSTFVDSASASALSYIDVKNMAVNKANIQNVLYDNSEITISSQADVNFSISRYAAFNNCKFRIGNETEYTALAGNTAEELRASFVARCVAAGYTVPSVTEYGKTLQAGRWVFSNSSAVDGQVLANSEIHQYEIPRLIAFGYKEERGDVIGIAVDKTKAGSFSPAYADSSLAVMNGSIGFKPTIDISTKSETKTESNIIWLGGKYQLNLIDIVHNFPKEYGVCIDSTPTLSDTSTTAIQEGKTYYVRSSGIDMASVVYNGVTYTSALLNNNNLFIGVAGKADFTKNGNALVYEVIDDTALHQTIQMRIVNKIPAGAVASGSLQAGYWYFVEPKDVNNPSGTVTYNGSTYPAYSSFLAQDGKLTFTLTGNVQVRKCWKDLYDEKDVDADTFWTDEQKPKWFDVVPSDLRCIMKYNNEQQSEMQTDAQGNYIASGHPDFYNSILGVSGNPGTPAFSIKGTFMQLRLKVTTQNPV